MKSNLMLGVHCSVGGGLFNAFTEADSLGIDTFQIFSQNQRQWVNKKLTSETIADFKKAWDAKKIKTIFSHCSYLINVASEDDELRKKSIDALKGEVERCHELGLAFCVLHPGAAKGQTDEQAIEKVVESLEQVLKSSAKSPVKILIENTAGQGTHIGYRFEHLHSILSGVKSKRIGVCFDTCHAFAAGYDLRNKAAFDNTFSAFDKIVGLQHLMAIHLNDSKTDLNSRVDRHEHIGKGKIGKEAFRLMMEKFPDIPKVIETDKEDDMDQVNLQLLRKLVK